MQDSNKAFEYWWNFPVQMHDQPVPLNLLLSSTMKLACQAAFEAGVLHGKQLEQQERLTQQKI